MRPTADTPRLRTPARPVRRAPRGPRAAPSAAALSAAAGLAAAWAQAAGAQTTRVTGVVYDSTAGAPLAGAVVQVVDAARPGAPPASAVADGSGRFSVGPLRVGEYLVAFAHPRLDSLGLTDVTRRVAVREAAAHVTLATPGAAAVRALHCGADAAAGAAVVGQVRGAVRGAPLDSAVLVARWYEIGFVPGRPGLARELTERRARAGADGWFALCGLPAGGEILLHAVHAVHARRGADSSGAVRVRLPADGVTRHDVHVGARGATGRLAGSVRGADGAPLSGALVTLAGAAAAVRTDDGGGFVLADAPAGTRTLTVRAVGFTPAERAVAVPAAGSDSVDVRLGSVRAVLDTVRVLAARTMPLARKLADFERRRRAMAAGTALDSARVRRANVTRPSDLFRFVPSATIVPVQDPRTGRRIELLRVRGAASGVSPLCLPLVFVDGMPLTLIEGLQELDLFLTPDDVLALEFYPGNTAPAQFYRYGSCGSLVVTTRW